MKFFQIGLFDPSVSPIVRGVVTCTDDVTGGCDVILLLVIVLSNIVLDTIASEWEYMNTYIDVIPSNCFKLES